MQNFAALADLLPAVQATHETALADAIELYLAAPTDARAARIMRAAAETGDFYDALDAILDWN